MSSSPRSIRFEESVGARLSGYVSRHPGWSGSSVANRLVDEGLRMDEHPGVIFRDGPTGRRAVLSGGPDVRDVIRAVRSARDSEPELSPDDVAGLVASNTGVSARMIDIAIRYWSAYPDEIDAWIDDVDSMERDAFAAWQRREGLLSS